MTDERDETLAALMSQLADGELASDPTNELLLGVLDDATSRARLKEILRLRRATAGWRNRQPDRPVMVVADRPSHSRRVHRAWGLTGLAAAACIGGVLVLMGVWAASQLRDPSRHDLPGQFAGNQVAQPAAVRVTPEQMQQVAKIFALHEAVAGPLAWYAADDQDIRLASARGAEANLPPIAVVLKLAPTGPGTAARTLVIVCREQQPAVIELPADSPDEAPLRVYLTPHTVNGKIDMQFAIAVRGGEHPAGPAGESSQGNLASLSGHRRIGLTETSLGQLAFGDRLVNVEASAWPIRQERK
jgi:hypothetical protein